MSAAEKKAIRSLIAYLGHLESMYPCKHGHTACAIRRDGVCIDELLSTYPHLANMLAGQLRERLEGGQ